MKRVTVHDVAAEAKVSLATIDRVLNERPGVRASTIEKVNLAISKIGFTRDQHAANMAKRREYRICFLIPSGDNAFMATLRDEVMANEQIQRQQRTTIELRDIPPFDGSALVKALDDIKENEFTGVVFVATDSPKVNLSIKRLSERGVIPITLVSDLPLSERVHFVGIDNIAAGRTAGSLLGRFLNDKKGKVAVIAGSLLLQDHNDRHFGFSKVIRSEFPGLEVLPVLESNDNNEKAELVVDELLAKHPDILGIYNLGAARRGLITSLKRHNRDGKVKIVAHDLTEDSIDALHSGIFDAVINQDPTHQIRSAIRIVRAFADGREYQQSQERIRIDIFIRDNLPD